MSDGLSGCQLVAVHDVLQESQDEPTKVQTAETEIQIPADDGQVPSANPIGCPLTIVGFLARAKISRHPTVRKINKANRMTVPLTMLSHMT